MQDVSVCRGQENKIASQPTSRPVSLEMIWHYYILLVKASLRKQISRLLACKGVSVSVRVSLEGNVEKNRSCLHMDTHSPLDLKRSWLIIKCVFFSFFFISIESEIFAVCERKVNFLSDISESGI